MDTTVDKTAADLERESQATLLSRARTGDEDAFRALVEPHRGELRAYCYRMLGSVQDAEDAVQNAMLRAWRGLAYFEGRSTMRSWLYSIATNTALDSARHRSRRELPVGFGPAAAEGAAADPSVNDAIWLEPCPNSWLADSPAASPEAKYEQRESVELAFMIMLQRLPPLQRAVLILRDVMGFTAAETAAHLGASVAAVNSALQRARSSARQSVPGPSQQSELRRLGSTRVANLAVRYADAIEAGDVETLLGMLTEDASWSMPPIPTWFRGHDALRAWLVRGPLPLGWRHHATTANGQLAVGGYLYDDDTGDFLPHVVDVLTLAGDKIASVTAFFAPDGQDPVGFFAAFGLPARAPASRLCLRVTPLAAPGLPVTPLAAPASRLRRWPRRAPGYAADGAGPPVTPLAAPASGLCRWPCRPLGYAAAPGLLSPAGCAPAWRGGGAPVGRTRGIGGQGALGRWAGGAGPVGGGRASISRGSPMPSSSSTTCDLHGSRRLVANGAILYGSRRRAQTQIAHNGRSFDLALAQK